MTEPEAAVAIVYTCGSDASVLLMRRSEREGDSWSGHWSFPGGRRDPADFDLLHTALRELEEECGIHLRRADREAEMPPRYARRRAGAYVPVTPFLFHLESPLPAVPDELEAVEAVWLPLSNLRDLSRHALLPVPGLPERLRYPGVPLNGAPLWGFTYRLICDWLGLAPQGDAREAGFAAAGNALAFLLARGLKLRSDWSQPDASRPDAPRVAEVNGAIPVAAVIERFAASGSHVLSINCLDVRPDRLRIVGPRFEEYAIRAVAGH